MILAVTATVLIAILVGIFLVRRCSSAAGATPRGPTRDPSDQTDDSETPGRQRLIVQEWRNGDLITIGTVVVDGTDGRHA